MPVPNTMNKIKIGLITPYTGGNLGDAAIQDAVIQSIQKRFENADIYLITLIPEVTATIHGIPSFPLTSNAQFKQTPFHQGATTYDNTDGRSVKRLNLLERIKPQLYKFPKLYSLLSNAYHKSLLFLMFPRLICKEIIHLLRVYKLMKKINLLIVSGGGQLDDYWGGTWAHPYALYKWGLIGKLVGSKYVFLSVGCCSLDSKLSRFFVGNALKFASFRSYRDQVSKNLLENLTFTHGDGVYPDLAFSYERNLLVENQKSPRNEKVIGISPIAYLSKHWPQKDINVYKNYIFEIAEFASDLINKGFSIVLFTTDSPDRYAADEAFSLISRNVNCNNSSTISIKQAITVAELIDLLRNVNLVVASRLHGIILSHILYRPVLAISYDRKVDTYMMEMGLSEFSLNIHGVEKDCLHKNFKILSFQKNFIKQRLKEKICIMELELEHQYSAVFEK